MNSDMKRIDIVLEKYGFPTPKLGEPADTAYGKIAFAYGKIAFALEDLDCLIKSYREKMCLLKSQFDLNLEDAHKKHLKSHIETEKTIKAENERLFELFGELSGQLEIKRFYLDGVTRRSTCPKCAESFGWEDFDGDYLYYPPINEWFAYPMCCQKCAHTWTVQFKLKISLESGEVSK